MITVRLPKEIEDQLEVLAAQHNRTKGACARRIILNFFEDLEDIELAEARLRNLGETISLEEVQAQLHNRETTCYQG
jgi:RHH-type transcriptional regulator, rel operon repressor / antitoxin RelB